MADLRSYLAQLQLLIFTLETRGGSKGGTKWAIAPPQFIKILLYL
jgi:hypothetical protein